jgi:hypothetical protein
LAPAPPPPHSFAHKHSALYTWWRWCWRVQSDGAGARGAGADTRRAHAPGYGPQRPCGHGMGRRQLAVGRSQVRQRPGTRCALVHHHPRNHGPHSDGGDTEGAPEGAGGPRGARPPGLGRPRHGKRRPTPLVLVLVGSSPAKLVPKLEAEHDVLSAMRALLSLSPQPQPPPSLNNHLQQPPHYIHPVHCWHYSPQGRARAQGPAR